MFLYNYFFRTVTFIVVFESFITTVLAATNPTFDPCQDNITNCHEYGNATYLCSNYGSWARDHCQRYCGFCTPLFTTPAPPCRDTKNNCHEYDINTCENYGEWSSDHCKRFCGHCETEGFHGSCRYKEKSYNTGDTWTDGCDYTCQCTDGQTGTYKCKNQCPIYYNLPSECKLVTKQKTCCKEPVCNFKKSQNSFIGQDKGQNTDGSDACQYKQKTYRQDQTWTDGTDYRCTCLNAAIGEYRCIEICASYPTPLPNECTLVPNSAGCEEPRCFFERIVGNFTGYGSITGHELIRVKPKCEDKIDNCHEYVSSSTSQADLCQKYKPWAYERCIKFCNLCDEPSPSENRNISKCAHYGKTYNHGESWNTSCGVQCVCENALYGYYRCNELCPKFDNIPTGCQLVRLPGYCCESVQCNFGFLQSSAMVLHSIGASPNNSIKLLSSQQPFSRVTHVTQATTTVAQPPINQNSCADSTIVRCSDSHVCSDSTLKTMCPLTCGLCTPPPNNHNKCTDSTMVKCSDSHICSDVMLKTLCPATCGLCSPSPNHHDDCTDSTLVKCSDSHVCSDPRLKALCPFTCGSCVPCKADSSLINCGDSRVCSDTRLRNFCPRSCGLCGTLVGSGNIFGR